MPTDDQQLALPPGTVLRGEYTIDRVIGYGAFGIVYDCRHRELDMHVAIKEYLPAEHATRHGSEVRAKTTARDAYQSGLERFSDEARHLVKIDHPNVVRCRDFFRANGTAYLVMDYEDGMSLH